MLSLLSLFGDESGTKTNWDAIFGQIRTTLKITCDWTESTVLECWIQFWYQFGKIWYKVSLNGTKSGISCRFTFLKFNETLIRDISLNKVMKLKTEIYPINTNKKWEATKLETLPFVSLWPFSIVTKWELCKTSFHPNETLFEKINLKLNHEHEVTSTSFNKSVFHLLFLRLTVRYIICSLDMVIIPARPQWR